MTKITVLILRNIIRLIWFKLTAEVIGCVVGGLVVGGGVVTISISPHRNGNTAEHPSSSISVHNLCKQEVHWGV